MIGQDRLRDGLLRVRRNWFSELRTEPDILIGIWHIEGSRSDESQCFMILFKSPLSVLPRILGGSLKCGVPL